MPRKPRTATMTEEDLNLSTDTITMETEGPARPSDNGKPEEWDDEPAPRTTRGRSASSTKGYQARKRGPVPRADQITVIRDELAEALGTIGGTLMLIRPLTGLVIVNRAEVVANSLASAAQSNPRLLKVLKGITSINAYGALVIVAGNVVVAAGVESGAIPLDHPLTIQIRPEIDHVRSTIEAQQAAQAQAQAVENGAASQQV